jgi:ABC-type molybdenum transport system ATPase subunit/photorepair protein PhrA
MIKYYNCGFLEFEKKKAAEDKKKYEEIEKFLKRNANTHPSTPIGRMVLDKKSWFDKYHAKSLALQSKFTFPLPVALENVANETLANPSDLSLINLQNVRFSYDVSTGHFIFNEPIAFNVKTTTRVGVMGPNGAGKSTLLKLLTHKLTPTEGSVVQHPKFKLAYFGQHSTAELNLDNTPMSFMQDHFPKVNSGQLRSHLGKTGIVGDVADTRISGLSYSQRSCVIFSKLTLACPHLLIMDEPTNFLDLESVDSLIAACNKYKGALLLVSHNRDFLKKCANQYLSVVPGHFELYDDLKTAEKATYTFIQEMEEGGHVSGKDTLTNNPGGGSVHSSQKVSTSPTPTVEKKINSAEAPAVPVPVTAPATTTSTSATIATDTPATPAKPKEPVVSTVTPFSVGDKIQAKYSQDGKWYSACIKALKGEMYLVHYTQYGNSELVTHDSVRNFIPSNNHSHNNHNKKSHPNNNKSRPLDR